MPPPHAHLVKRRYPPEDVPTTKFVRPDVDVDDTVPVELYSQPYERVEIEASRPYELIEIEQEVEFTAGFDLAAPDEIAAEETEHIVHAPASTTAMRLTFAILVLCGAVATGFCIALVAFD